MAQHSTFPSGMPKPEDDGAANHLAGLELPSTPLPSTAGTTIDASTLSGLSVIFCYPRTAAPGETVPDEWNAIPGARGCTPQACCFRDAADDLLGAGVSHLFGLSTQRTEYQQELKERTRLPYQLLSDERHELIGALKLPTLAWEGSVLTKRLTMVVRDGRIEKVFYPVFPPGQSADEVLQWSKQRSR